MADNKGLLSIIDANFNRSREGLRVCEDIARFMMRSGPISSDLRSVRHGISSVLCRSRSAAYQLIGSRSPDTDIGRSPKPGVAISRKNVCDIFIANIERAKESVRVLEEFFKLTDTKLSAELSGLRFRIYGIEKRSVKKLAPLRNTR